MKRMFIPSGFESIDLLTLQCNCLNVRPFSGLVLRLFDFGFLFGKPIYQFARYLGYADGSSAGRRSLVRSRKGLRVRVKKMTSVVHNWDFFLAHAGSDTSSAEHLYNLLVPRAKVFLDSRCLLPGDNWDEELASAQRASFITLVLISSGTEQAYYQREEIAAAINMARKNKDRHRVVPIFLDGWPSDDHDMPYGLRLKHGVSVPETGGLHQVASRLLSLVGELKSRNISPMPSEQTEPSSPAKQKASYNTAAIRKLLTDALTDDELNSLCMDEYPKVWEQFATGMNKAQKIQQLIEYCSKRNEFPRLLELIRNINTDKFREYQQSVTR